MNFALKMVAVSEWMVVVFVAISGTAAIMKHYDIAQLAALWAIFWKVNVIRNSTALGNPATTPQQYRPTPKDFTPGGQS